MTTNTEGTTKLKPSMDVKLSEQNFEEENSICIVSRHFLPNDIPIIKRKTVTSQWETLKEST